MDKLEYLNNDLTVTELMKIIFKNKQLDRDAQKEIILQALNIAEDCEDYTSIATNICHDSVLNNKEWGKEIFQKAIEKVDLEYGVKDLYTIARQISDKKQLNNKEWSKKLYEIAIEKTDDIDDLLDIADNVTDASDIDDKDLSTIAINKALQNARDSSEKIEIIKIICHDDALGDKKWAKLLLKQIENNLEYDSDYLEIAVIYSNVKCLNDKDNGNAWFQKAIEVENSFMSGDYLKIAQYIFNDDYLGDKWLAGFVCFNGYKNTYSIQNLIEMAKLTFQTNRNNAKKILNHAILLIENDKDDIYNSDDLFNIAANISDQKLSVLPFFNDRRWGKEVFKKSTNKASTEEDREIIKDSMKQYLKNQENLMQVKIFNANDHNKLKKSVQLFCDSGIYIKSVKFELFGESNQKLIAYGIENIDSIKQEVITLRETIVGTVNSINKVSNPNVVCIDTIPFNVNGLMAIIIQNID